jgi:molybdopterin-containing oxidoreductase family membrane subunit
MVMTLAIPIRKFYNLEDMVTMRHLENMAKVMLATGMIVAYGYMMETFMAFYSGNEYEHFLMMNRFKGPYAIVYWSLIACNIVIPQLMWFRRVRTSIPALFTISLIVNMGMWLERFVIVVISLSRDFVPSIWNMYYPTKWDWMTYIGTFGLFFTLFFLFVRFLPMISIVEMRTLVRETDENPEK